MNIHTTTNYQAPVKLKLIHLIENDNKTDAISTPLPPAPIYY
jgi:hypothetical protein